MLSLAVNWLRSLYLRIGWVGGGWGGGGEDVNLVIWLCTLTAVRHNVPGNTSPHILLSSEFTSTSNESSYQRFFYILVLLLL